MIGLFFFVSIVTTAETEAQSLIHDKLYIVEVVGKERSEGHDRLTRARLAHAITVIDIDHDGVADYMVDYNKVINTHWCGTGGCDFELWRGRKGGHPVRVWNEMVREFKIAHRRGETVFDFDFHGSNCGTFGNEACPASFAWNAKAGRMVERPTPQGGTAVRLIDPMPLTRAQVPANVFRLSLAASRKCKANGSDAEAYLPVSIPDIDGDGLRDWSLTIAVCDKPGDFDLQQILFATAGHPMKPVIAASGVRFAISFATKPASVARVNVTETCGGFGAEPEPKICTQTPMMWNAATRKLQIVAQ